MKTLLICHHDAPLDREGLARWLASFTDLVGVLVIHERASHKRRRLRRELRRVGALRFLDVLAFRLHYMLFRAAADRTWERSEIERLRGKFPQFSDAVEVFATDSPNSGAAAAFIQRLGPDLVVARCKVLLKEEIFAIPPLGTVVMHPGICPEYRNAHGCFWATVNGDGNNVGMTLLKIDAGVDTGPVYGYFRLRTPIQSESHVVVQHRVVFENLEALRTRLLEMMEGVAKPIDTSGRTSRAWGQPWLTAYLRWKRASSKRSPRPAVA